MIESVVKSIIFLILLALGGYFFVIFRRRNWFMAPKNSKDVDTNALQIINRLSIGGRHWLAVIRYSDQKFLIGISPTAITTIGEIITEEISLGPAPINGVTDKQNERSFHGRKNRKRSTFSAVNTKNDLRFYGDTS
jgi:flagellar biogenesis protein FliO